MTRVRAVWLNVYARVSQEWGACLVNSRNARTTWVVPNTTTDDQRLAGLLHLR